MRKTGKQRDRDNIRSGSGHFLEQVNKDIIKMEIPGEGMWPE